MSDLILPRFKNSIPSSRSLSMDEYYEFVKFNLRYVIKEREGEKDKRKTGIKKPFVL